jgi:Xaa-Pro aminopeptidase
LVNTGPDSAIGHAAPSDLVVQQGHLVHFDFGIKQNGFCSDIQRMWYVLETDESVPPSEILHAWDAVRAALLAGAGALKPGVRGWEVDQVARQKLVDQGFPEYQHAFGHHLGRVAHDGSTLLGPRWDRYGSTPDGVVEKDNVFAIELGVKVEKRGWVYLEENVLVGEDGLEWLSTPQTELLLIRDR